MKHQSWTDRWDAFDQKMQSIGYYIFWSGDNLVVSINNEWEELLGPEAREHALIVDHCSGGKTTLREILEALEPLLFAVADGHERGDSMKDKELVREHIILMVMDILQDEELLLFSAIGDDIDAHNAAVHIADKVLPLIEEAERE